MCEMKAITELPVNVPWWRRILKLPDTRLGWWSFGLAIVYLILMIINSAVFMRLTEDVPWRTTLLPFYGILILLCGFVAGVVGLTAVTRQHERSWLVWLSILIGLNTLIFVLGEFLIPH
jgi:hypothetical protein